MKLSSRLTSVCLIICLVTSQCMISGNAVDINNNITVVDVTKMEDCRITKGVDSSGQTIICMERTSTVPYSMAASDYSDTKDMLRKMNILDSTIDNLPEEDLHLYATTSYMYTVSSYLKTDGNGQTSIVSEDEALAAQSLEENLARGGLSYTNYTEDSYMFLCVSVANLDNAGELRFMVDAKWLTMPVYRLSDSLGISSTEATVSTNNFSAYTEYYAQTIVYGEVIKELTYDDTHKSIPVNKFQAPLTNGPYNGGGITFSLPNDDISAAYDIPETRVMRFHAHLRFNGHTTHPDIDTWYNVVGSYSHAKRQFQTNPSLSIDGKGMSGSIGLSMTPTDDRRNVLVEAHYVP